MAKTRRAYSGNAASTTLASGISGADTSISITAATGWPSGAPFYVVIDPGTAAEEKVLVTRSSTTLTVSGSRGADDTSASSHSAGAVIYPVFTATDANEANLMASTLTTKGDLLTHGSSDFARLAVGSTNQVLVADSAQSTGMKWANVTSAMITDLEVATADINDGAVTEAKIADSAVTSAKIADGTIVNADINASAAIALSKLATGALPTAITVASANIVNNTIDDADISPSANIALSKLAAGTLPTAITVASANIVNGTIVADDLADGAVTSAKILDGTIVNADINASAAIAQTKIAPTGISRTRTTTASIPNNSWTTVGFAASNFSKGTGFSYSGGSSEITVPAGMIIIQASLRFDANATGTRGIRIIDALDVVVAQMNCAAAPTGVSVVNCSFLFASGGANSFRVQAYQTSGGALDVEGEPTTNFEAIRVAGE